MNKDIIYRKDAIDLVSQHTFYDDYEDTDKFCLIDGLKNLPPAQQEYEPVTAEDFAKTMSENTVYQYMVWYGVFLTLMKEQWFVICKKTM